MYGLRQIGITGYESTILGQLRIGNRNVYIAKKMFIFFKSRRCSQNNGIVRYRWTFYLILLIEKFLVGDILEIIMEIIIKILNHEIKDSETFGLTLYVHTFRREKLRSPSVD